MVTAIIDQTNLLCFIPAIMTVLTAVYIYTRRQDDVVMTTLTVRENLKFSADLRLDKTYSEEQKVDRVQSVINQLSLGE